MKHLLLTKFQGALIGGNLIYLDRYQIAPNQLIMNTTPALIDGINYLTFGGKFAIEDWSKRVNPDLNNSASALIAMLPLMLFFHEDRPKLREVVINISHEWQLDWETCSSAVAIGYLVSRSLTESFNTKTAISQLLDEMTNLHPLIFQELSTLDRALAGSMSLHQVERRLARIEQPVITSVLLAMSSFMATPEDFSLATRRVAKLETRSLLACALTGILAGAHNSLSGIPLNGYIATQERTQWQALAAQLLNAWAGVDLQHPQPPDLLLAIAAPNVIQRRG
ncbi:ADP-ribosylglycohydrolase family protein [Chamaesiphon sp. OTE_8_metabat_110]|uniref:ADP-ribosylglycohydrolase family protein n=1 Tax=Chamaesiphon sp. OTE_8_metabat_110 TaxID=2964696 RepID=UPI00286C19BB|nr:ADP-ribosylglycohydrolase family protein [Chamaesiphon sp. OTE_8_metabat_110]